MSRHSAALDTLRAFAVALVLVDHVLETVSPWHPFDWQLGRLGVLLFFVHTACVLMASLARTPATGWALASHFYLRRAFRLYPLALATVAVVVLLDIPRTAWGAEVADRSPLSLFANAMLVQNLLGVASISSPMWSLPLEVQMYALLPAVFWAVSRWRIGAALAMWAVALPVANAVPMIGTSLLPFVPCFMAGVVAYCLLTRANAAIPGWAWLPLLTIVAAGYVAFSRLFDVVHAGPAAWGVCMAVALLLPLIGPVPRLVAVPSEIIARYSYGIYLVHLPALWVAFVVLDNFTAPVQWMVFVSLLSAASAAAYHLIEAPMIRLGWRVADRGWPLSETTVPNTAR